MKRSYWFLVIALVLTALLIIYNLLGGFNEIAVNQIENAEYKIIGKEYEGRISANAWENLFYETKGLVDDGKLRGDLCIVWYQQPNEDVETGHAFVGIKISETQTVPDQYELREIKTKGILQVELKGHVLVLPSPEKVIDKMKTFARTHELKLQNLIIDRYTSDEAVYTEIPY